MAPGQIITVTNISRHHVMYNKVPCVESSSHVGMSWKPFAKSVYMLVTDPLLVPGLGQELTYPAPRAQSFVPYPHSAAGYHIPKNETR